jgi:hypothetical protein
MMALTSTNYKNQIVKLARMVDNIISNERQEGVDDNIMRTRQATT